MSEPSTYTQICNILDYDDGLIENMSEANTPIQRHFFKKATKTIKNFDAILFSGDIPYIFFKNLSSYNEDLIKNLHKSIWNQNKVPFLFIITPNELRIYNCFEEPANPEYDNIDNSKWLLKKINFLTDKLDEIMAFSKLNIDTGSIWKSVFVSKLNMNNAADVKLLENIGIAENNMFKLGLSYPIIHNLIGRSLFTLYLQDRGIINSNDFNKMNNNDFDFFDILNDVNETYSFFENLSKKFNGDLFPIQNDEKNQVNLKHLSIIKELFSGTELDSGQRKLWRPYDFSIIPIELISSIYEQFLHSDINKKNSTGAYYTQHFLVEFMFNEILPYPSNNDCNYNKKILDPACGSGIFLVEGYKRLVYRWIYKNKKNPSYEDLIKILTDNIFGIDIDEEAIKVATFSLYLSMLDFLEVSDIGDKKLPHLIYPKGLNLFKYNTILKGPFEKNEYDIIIGNVPWKRDGLDKDVSDYLFNLGFAQEYCMAFFWRVRELCSDNGIIALIGTSKILYNTESKDRHFRNEFFSSNTVDIVIELSLFNKRKSVMNKKLFSSNNPGSIFIYRPVINEQYQTLFCTPMPEQSGKFPSIVIDESSLKYISNIDFKKNPNIFKIALWGFKYDLEIINKLNKYNKMKSYFDDKKFYCGWGFQRGNKENKRLQKLPYLSPEYFTRFTIDKETLVKNPIEKYNRYGTIEAYYGPHIIVKRGIKDKKPLSAFSKKSFTYTNTVFGIHDPNENVDLLKTITLFLNSKLATYYIFLNASDWGVNREAIVKEDILNLPGIPFIIDIKTKNKLSLLYDKLILSIERNNINFYNDIMDKIDSIFIEFVNLSENEIIHINDIINVKIDLVHNHFNSVSYKKVDKEDLFTYSKIFCETINKFINKINIFSSAIIYYNNTPVQIMLINIGNKENLIEFVKIEDYKKTLKKLKISMLELYSSEIYFKRTMKIYEKNKIYIIKSSEYRYWTKSNAINDALKIISDGILEAD